MYDDDFTMGVEDGLRLAKRIYFGNDRAVAAPKHVTPMEKTTRFLYPTSPMVYAVIINPEIVDNPDMPSYQPHVHGRCNPPALIPLQMNGISFDVDCYLDTAFVTMTGSWRVHCVTGDANCSCRIAIPMGEEGSILGAEVEVPRITYTTELASYYEEEIETVANPEEGGLLKAHIFTLSIPQVDGGSNLSVKVRWSQTILYKDREFILSVPYKFPEYVTPAGKKLPKKEKIHLKIDCGLNTEVVFKGTSHPLKEQRRVPGKLDFLYEAHVLAWSSTDFVFRYQTSTSNPFGGVLLKSPLISSTDQRDMFYLYLAAGADNTEKICEKEVVFVVDISESMKDSTIEVTKNAVVRALSNLDEQDSFDIIAFNDQMNMYSPNLEVATKESIKNASEWVETNFVVAGGTNMSIALNQALELFSGTKKSIPLVFFITDGSVENERQMCDDLQKWLHNEKSDLCPRINTFGIGSFCNHYFLRMLSMISKGHNDASYDGDSFEDRMQMWFTKASSVVMANVVIDGLDEVDDLEIYPSTIPDLCSERPLMISGRYKGNFPDKLKGKGILPDMSSFSIDIQVQQARDIPLDKVLARKQMEAYTALAWLSQNKELEEKVAKISLETGIASEFTHLILLKTEQQQDKRSKSARRKKSSSRKNQEPKTERIKSLQYLGLGFGSLVATHENALPGFGPRPPTQSEMIARVTADCCADAVNNCCCMCGIQICAKFNNECSVVLTQLCGAVTCFSCWECCR